MSFVDDVERCCKGLEHVNPGTASCCEQCRRDFAMAEDDPAWQELCDEGGFSWRACDTCGSTYGGMRYSGHGFDAAGAVVHLSLCEDCLLYFANGDLPNEEYR